MNEQLVFTVFDIKSKLFGTPHFEQTIEVAIRNFKTACEDPTTNLNRYPEDYTLYNIGIYNVETGQIQPADKTPIANASEFINKLEQFPN